MNIISNKYIFFSISGFLTLASFVLVIVFGLKPGIDFTGGSLLEVEFSGVRPAPADIRAALEPGTGAIIAQPIGERGALIRFKEVTEEEHQSILRALGALGGGAVSEKRFDSIGPTIGGELKRKALVAILIASAAIVLYIAWAFRKVSKPVSSWKYGVAAVIALLHDITIPIGLFAVLGHYYGAEIDALFITALLTIMGFSVHDTIVVFDRTRENLQNLRGTEPFANTVERSIKETIARSINTSLTTILSLLAIFLYGGETVRYFSLALIVGIAIGTYSSIFVASPILVLWHQLTAKK